MNYIRVIMILEYTIHLLPITYFWLPLWDTWKTLHRNHRAYEQRLCTYVRTFPQRLYPNYLEKMWKKQLFRKYYWIFNVLISPLCAKSTHNKVAVARVSSDSQTLFTGGLWRWPKSSFSLLGYPYHGISDQGLLLLKIV